MDIYDDITISESVDITIDATRELNISDDVTVADIFVMINRYQIEGPKTNLAYLEQSANRSIARDSNGYLYAVYNEWNVTLGAYTIRCSRSTDEGQNWTQNVIHEDSSNAQYTPKIAIDSLDNIYIVWEGLGSPNNPTKKNIFYKKGTWDSWGGRVIITDNFNEQFVPGVAVDSNDDVHFVWYGYGTGVETSYYQIRYRKLAGGSLEDIVDITDVSPHQYDPAIAIDSNDNVHIVWYEDVATDNILYAKYDAGTDTWGSVETVVNDAELNRIPSIAIDSNDDVHISYHVYQSSVSYKKRTTSWQASEVVGTMAFPDKSAYNSIALDANDDIYIVFSQVSESLPNQVVLRKKISGSWKPAHTITYETTYQNRPGLLWAKYPINNSQPNVTKVGCIGIWEDSNSTSSDLTSGSIELFYDVNLEYQTDYQILIKEPITVSELVNLNALYVDVKDTVSISEDTNAFIKTLKIITSDSIRITEYYNDDFETSFGNWSNVEGDDQDWTRDSGGTPTSTTGPTTGQGASTYYLYCETSTDGIGFPSKTFSLEGSTLNGLGGTITFYYHMYGTSTGTLNVDEWDGDTWTNIWTLSGNQGDAWSSQQSVNYSSGVSKLRFYYTSGSSFRGDTAIDNVEIFENSDIDIEITGGVSDLDIDVSDSVSITENIITENENLGSVDISESINIAELVNIGSSYNLLINDFVSVNENITIQNALSGIDISSSVIISENVQIEMSTPSASIETVSDSISVVENIDVQFSDSSILVNDSVSLSELISTGSLLSISVLETVTINESITTQNVQLGNVNVNDVVVLSENVDSLFANSINVNDTIVVSELITVNNSQLGGIDVSDNIVITESVSILNTQLGDVSISDNVSTSELITTAQVVSVSVIDTITISENIVIENTQLGDIDVSNNVAILENVQIDQTYNISVNENISLTESLTIENAILQTSLFDSVSIFELVNAGNNLSILTADNVSVSENITIENIQLGEINVNDNISISENVQSTEHLGDVDILDTLSIGESVSTNTNSFVDIFEILSINESVVIENENLGGINVSDTIIISESGADQEGILNIGINDSVLLIENIVSNATITDVVVSDNVSVSEYTNIPAPTSTITISVFDNITVSDTPINQSPYNIGINVSEDITVSEEVSMDGDGYQPYFKKRRIYTTSRKYRKKRKIYTV